MKRARIVLSLVALFAVAGGAFAFKAMRNGQPAYTLTDQYTIGGVVYTAADPTLVPLNPARFISTTGVLTTVFSTTSSVLNQTTTFTRVGGTQTITFPVFQGVELQATRTTALN